MPIATLKYKLPEEADEFKQAQKAGDYACAIHDFSQWLRQKYKYESVETISLEEVRKQFYEILEEWDVNDV